MQNNIEHKAKYHTLKSGSLYKVGGGHTDFTNLILIGGLSLAQKHGESVTVDCIENHAVKTVDASKSAREVLEVLCALSESAVGILNHEQLQTFYALTSGTAELLGQLHRDISGEPESLQEQLAGENFFDSIGRWLAECEVKGTLPAKGSVFSDFYTKYNAWCDSNEMTTNDKDVFMARMIEEGYYRHCVN